MREKNIRVWSRHWMKAQKKSVWCTSNIDYFSILSKKPTDNNFTKTNNRKLRKHNLQWDEQRKGQETTQSYYMYINVNNEQDRAASFHFQFVHVCVLRSLKINCISSTQRNANYLFSLVSSNVVSIFIYLYWHWSSFDAISSFFRANAPPHAARSLKHCTLPSSDKVACRPAIPFAFQFTGQAKKSSRNEIFERNYRRTALLIFGRAKWLCPSHMHRSFLFIQFCSFRLPSTDP